MNRQLDETICAVAGRTFEELGFMLPVTEEEFCGEEGGARIAVCVRFAGPFLGGIYVIVPLSMLPDLAGNMLGLDGEEPTRDQQVDAVKELTNVVSGNLLPALAGPELVFNVYAPEVLAPSEVPELLHNAPPAARVRLLLDSGAADVVLFTNQARFVFEGATP